MVGVRPPPWWGEGFPNAGGEAATTMWVEADPIFADKAALIVGVAKPPPTTGGQAEPAENGCLLLYIKALRLNQFSLKFLCPHVRAGKLPHMWETQPPLQDGKGWMKPLRGAGEAVSAPWVA